MSPWARVMLGAFQSLNSTSSTFSPSLAGFAHGDFQRRGEGGGGADLQRGVGGLGRAAAEEDGQAQGFQGVPAWWALNERESGVRPSAGARPGAGGRRRRRVPPAGARGRRRRASPQGAGSVGGLVAAACLQLGHHQVDEVGVALRLHGAGQIEAVQAGIGDPAFEVVGDLARVAYQGHVAAAQGQLVEELAHGGVGARHGEVLHHRLDGVVLLVADRLVESVARQVDAAGAGEVRQAGLGAGVAAVLGMLVAGPGRGGGADHVDAHEDPDVLGATAGADHRRADALHQLAGGLAGLSGDEHAFGVARGEGQATLRGAGLEQHRGALWRGPRRGGSPRPGRTRHGGGSCGSSPAARRPVAGGRRAPRRLPSCPPRACRGPPGTRRRGRSGGRARSCADWPMALAALSR